MKIMKNIALALVIIGAINWGLIGFFKFDLVSSVFGGQAAIMSRIIFAIVGISGIYAITLFSRNRTATQSYSNRKLNYNTETANELYPYTSGAVL